MSVQLPSIEKKTSRHSYVEPERKRLLEDSTEMSPPKPANRNRTVSLDALPTVFEYNQEEEEETPLGFHKNWDLDSTTEELLDPANLRGRKFVSFKQRKIFRAVLTGTILTLLIIALYFGFRAIHDEMTFVLPDLSKPGSRLFLDMDSCDIAFRDVSEEKWADSSLYHLFISKSKGGEVSKTVDGNDVYVTIKNNRDYLQKYSSWTCDVTLYAPDGKVLPHTYITASGKQITTVLGYRQDWGDNNLSVIAVAKKPYPPTYLTTTQLAPYVAINLYDCNAGNLNVNISAGYVHYKRGVISQGAQIHTLSASVFLRLKHDFTLITNTPSTVRCENAFGYNCLSYVNDSFCNQTQFFTENSNRSLSSVPIRMECTNCSSHITAMALRENVDNDYGTSPIITRAGSFFSGVNFTVPDIMRIREVFNMLPPRDLVYFGITGPGTATSRGRWVWAARDIYLVFPPSYLDVFSIFLLSPRRSELNVTLSPTFCPGLDDELSMDAMIALDSILKSITLAKPSPDSIFVFEYGFEQELSSTNSRVLRNPYSGEYYLSMPSFSENESLLIILILNIALTLISSIYLTYVIARKTLVWRSQMVDRWGSLWYGEEWKYERKRIIAKAGFYFLLEFIIGFPKQRRGYIKQSLTVVVHFAFILGMITPIFLMTTLYELSSMTYTHQWQWTAGFIGYGICVIYCLISFIFLFLYYWEITWKLDAILSVTMGVATTIVLFLDCIFCINVCYWILLGALIKPARILPYASVIMVMIFHSVAFFQRIKHLRRSLKSKEVTVTAEAVEAASRAAEERELRKSVTPEDTEEREDGEGSQTTGGEEGPKIKGVLTVQEAMGLLKESQLLSISDLTLREQIINEIVAFFLLILFFAFILVGFTSLDVTAVGNGDTVGTAVSTLIVFFVGTGVNVPLSATTDKERKKQWDRKVIEEAQRQRTRDSKKKS
ncbi:hypothetical protein PROFUN_13704 [Planoprotostelium fungivorum]|uniref:Transmembrane protein n=1 Tax=Planoprotostelium fungivorum TaxID=1890364 RepID=A0A2P6N3B3_9EUKA|nr:hypothetical protein PROFUN_13704 [Planoprotostelium fungivorum]